MERFCHILPIYLIVCQFLDEADLLADNIAVLAAPGKLVACGSPVHLKSTLGEGYTVDIHFNVISRQEKDDNSTDSVELLERIRTLAPSTYVSSSAPNHTAYHLKLKDPAAVRDVLQMVEDEKEQYNIATYSVLGTSIEDIFLNLMHTDTESEDNEKVEKVEKAEEYSTPVPSLPPAPPPPLQLTNGRRRSPFSQAFTIFHKRALITRRSWLTPCLAVVVAVAGSCVPLFFLSDRETTCSTKFEKVFPRPLYLPLTDSAAYFISDPPAVLISPSGILSTLGNSTAVLLQENLPDNATFVNTIDQTYRNQSLGGVSFDTMSGQTLFAWEATPPGTTGLQMLNLASNIIYNHALNTTDHPNPRLILASFEQLPGLSGAVLDGLKWLAFYGAAMVSMRLHPYPLCKDAYRSVGGLPGFLFNVRVERASIVGTGHAAIEWSRGSSRPLARASYV